MIQIDLPPLVKRLNLFSRQALEMAASECMSQQAAEITVSHVLIQMLAMPRSDLRVITRQGDIGMEELRQALTVENYTTARSADSYPAFSPMLVEWLKEGWLLASAEMQHSELRGGVLLLALLHSPLRYIPPAAARLLTGINRDRLQQDFVQWTQESAESVVPDADGKGAGTMTDASDTLLARYAKNMTADARNGRLDPVLCRDHEIDLMIDILCRRRKNNPVVVGEAGVGKSALIEGLALRIVAGQVPDKLKNTDIMTLDLGALQAGASVKGEFEKRFKGLMAEVISSPVPVILFIDELHTMVGAGKADGAMDAGNMLKPALARGELHCVGATTLDEYRQYIEKDAALERRFQKVFVAEPSVEDTIAILRGLKERYELHHHVQITDPAIVAAATLSHRYIADRQLPDKAIDLIDEAASSIRMQIDSKPEELDRLDRRIIQLKLEQQALMKESDEASKKRLDMLNEELSDKERQYSELEEEWKAEKASLSGTQTIKAELEQAKIAIEQARRVGDLARMSELQYGKIPELEKQLEAATQLEGKTMRLLRNKVTDAEIAEVLARWTGIPVSRMMESEREKLLRMEQELHHRVIGQNEAVDAVSNAIRRSRAGLADPNRPIGSFLFLGPTGVGKTELCKALANFMFDSDEAMVRIDMSEFMEKHSVSRLVGAPPGYVGYEEGGYLTEAVRRRPYSVILLDEVEKAHPDVFNILLQVLDDGRLTDGQGRTVDFRNTVVIMTSNLGSDLIQERFGELDYAHMKELVLGVVSHNFRPEFINRIDEVVVFHPLGEQHIASIAQIQLKRLYKRLEERGYEIHISDEALKLLSENGYDPVYGARPLKRAIQQQIENPLAQQILSGELVPGKVIRLEVNEDRIVAVQ